MVKKIILTGLFIITTLIGYSQSREYPVYRHMRIYNGLSIGENGSKLDSAIIDIDTLYLYVNGGSIPFKILYNPSPDVIAGLGLSSSGDTLNFGNTTLYEDMNLGGGGNDIIFGYGTDLNYMEVNSDSIGLKAGSKVIFEANGSEWIYDGTYWRSSTDTLTTYDDVRTLIEEGTYITANNGLTKNGTSIGLDGILIRNTSIYGAGYDYQIGSTISRVNNFRKNGLYSWEDMTKKYTWSIDESDELTWDGDLVKINNDTAATNTFVRSFVNASQQDLILPYNLHYIYDASTLDSRPGTGYFRLDNAVYSNVNYIYIDDFDKYGINKVDFINQIDTGSYITISDGINYINYRYIGNIIDGGFYTKYEVSYLNSSGVISGSLIFNIEVSNSKSGQGFLDSVLVSSTNTLILKEDSLYGDSIDAKFNSIQFGSGTYIDENSVRTDTMYSKSGGYVNYYNNASFNSNSDEYTKSYIFNNGFISNSNSNGGYTDDFVVSISSTGNSSVNFNLLDNPETQWARFSWSPSQFIQQIQNLDNSIVMYENGYLSSGYRLSSSKISTEYEVGYEYRPASPYNYLRLYNKNSVTGKYNQIFLDSTKIRFNYYGYIYAEFDTNGITAPYASFTDSVYSPKGKFDTINIAGAEITDTIDAQTAIESISYNKLNFAPQSNGTYSEGDIYYSNVKKNFVTKNGITNYSGDINRELNLRFYNATGDVLADGVILRSVGSYITAEGDTIFQGGYAGNGSLDSLNGIAMVTAPCAIGGIGEATVIGRVNGVNHGYADNTVIYLDHKGGYTTTQPEPPLWSKIVGRTGGASSIYFYGFSETEFNPNPEFSASFTRETETITNTGQDDALLITNATNDLYTEDLNYGFLFQGDTINPDQNGDYSINGTYAFQGDAATGDDWRIGIFVDGAEVFTVLRTSSSSNKGVVAFSKIYPLTTNNWVSIRIINTTNGTRSSIFTDGSINFEYVTE